MRKLENSETPYTFEVTWRFLYGRDSKNQPKAQHPDTFSEPYDERFFQKLEKHLRNPNVTVPCMDEALRQFYTHAGSPLATHKFFSEPNYLQAVKLFFVNDKNRQFRDKICEILNKVLNNRASVQSLLDAGSEQVDELVTFIFDNFQSFPILLDGLMMIFYERQIAGQYVGNFILKALEYLKFFQNEILQAENITSEVNSRTYLRARYSCQLLSVVMLFGKSDLMTFSQSFTQMSSIIQDILRQYEKLPVFIIAQYLVFLNYIADMDIQTICYVEDMKLYENLLVFMKDPEDLLAINALELIAKLCLGYPIVITMLYQQKLDAICTSLVLRLSTVNQDVISRVYLATVMFLDSPLRRFAELFQPVVAQLKALNAWEPQVQVEDQGYQVLDNML